MMVVRKWLRKSPKVFHLISRGYYAAQYAAERYLLGTRLQHIKWRMHGAYDLQTSLAEPHRQFLAERIGHFAPFESILEVGCNAGPNLVALRRKYSDVRLYGLDISDQAIRAAMTNLTRESVDNVSVSVGRAEDLQRFADKSGDVVFTSATLMFVGPDMIAGALSEMVRVARKGILLHEWHLFEAREDGKHSHWDHARWVHDYLALLQGMPDVKAVRVERIPPGMCQDGAWKMYGALVEVDM